MSGPGPGTFVIPSFVDAHLHLAWTGMRSILPDMSGAGSKEELLDMLEAASGEDTGEVLRVEGLDETGWPEPVLPTLSEVDRVTGDRPLFLRRVCGHRALVNSGTLAMVPEGSPGVDRRAGIITEGLALSFDEEHPPERGLVDRAVAEAVRAALAAGITGVLAFEERHSLRAVMEGASPLRIGTVLKPGPVFAEHGGAPEGCTGLKAFLDGSIGAGTAALSGSYLDGTRGEVLMSARELRDHIMEAFGMGLTPFLHAIGGRALELAAEVGSRAGREAGGAVRVEHAEELLPVWPGSWDPEVHLLCMQPNFVSRWQMPGGMYESRMPPDAVRRLNPFRRVAESGVRFCFGSDGMPMGPLDGLPGATGHPCPELRLDRETALLAYTTGAAAVSGLRGLELPVGPGRPADLAVLSGSPVGSLGFEDIEVLATICGGDVVSGSLPEGSA